MYQDGSTRDKTYILALWCYISGFDFCSWCTYMYMYIHYHDYTHAQVAIIKRSARRCLELFLELFMVIKVLASQPSTCPNGHHKICVDTQEYAWPLKFAVLKSWHIRGRLILRFPIKIISQFPTQMLCFPTQIKHVKVGTLCVKDHQVLRLEDRLGADGNTKKLEIKYYCLKKIGNKMYIRGHLILRI